MSEYQYYEFVALDRSLTKAEMQELRNVSSQAEMRRFMHPSPEKKAFIDRMKQAGLQ